MIDGADYQEVMDFEPPQAHEILAPLLTEQALSDMPVFGPGKVDVRSSVAKTLADTSTEHPLAAEVSQDLSSSVLFEQATSVAEKLRVLRLAAKQGKDEPDEALLSQLERHEKLLTATNDMAGLSSKERFVVDHTMLLRAQEGYRFDFAKNQKIVADDPWLRDVWVWVAGEFCHRVGYCWVLTAGQAPTRLLQMAA